MPVFNWQGQKNQGPFKQKKPQVEDVGSQLEISAKQLKKV